jgi:hypothetical protein
MEPEPPRSPESAPPFAVAETPSLVSFGVFHSAFAVTGPAAAGSDVWLRTRSFCMMSLCTIIKITTYVLNKSLILIIQPTLADCELAWSANQRTYLAVVTARITIAR